MNIIKKLFWGILLVAFLATFLISCSGNKIFEKEMYKNVVSFISEDQQYNIFKEVISMDQDTAEGFIAVSVGGTKTISDDITIYFEENQEPLDFYNFSVFSDAEEEYALALPKKNYRIENMSVTIPKGNRTGRSKVLINPNGLSPDSTYFISLKIDEAQTSAEMNESKMTLLYQIIVKNAYASSEEPTLYKLDGIIDEARTTGNVVMFPIARNKVRIMAGDLPFEAKKSAIDDGSIIIEVNEDNTVNILPYKNIEVHQLFHPDFPNTFSKETDRFGRTYNVFLLSYEYKLPEGSTRVVREELRREILD